MRIAIPTICMFLAACGAGERVKAPPPAGQTHKVSIEWRIVDRDELERVYQESGMEIRTVRVGAHTRRDRLFGFAGKLPDGSDVVYTLPPERVDDQAACTLGHEIIHITHGDYHR